MAAGDWLRELCPQGPFWVAFVTLTYRPGCQWERRHVSEFLRGLRRDLRRQGVPLRYVWVAELQERRMARSGETARQCMHYHLAVWLPRGVLLPKPDESGLWPHGWSQVEVARRPVGYLMKYASKGTDAGTLPKGARMCGAGGLEREGRAVVRYWLLPRYQRERCMIEDDVHRCRGGGWVSLETGEWWPPP